MGTGTGGRLLGLLRWLPGEAKVEREEERDEGEENFKVLLVDAEQEHRHHREGVDIEAWGGEGAAAGD